MKTIQTCVLLILLLATKTYAQDGIASPGTEKGTISSEPENLESLAANTIPDSEASGADNTISEAQNLSLETDSSTLPSEDSTAEEAEASSTGIPEINEEIATILQESASSQTASDPSLEILADTNQVEEEKQESEQDLESPSEQKLVETENVVLVTENIPANGLENDPTVPEIEKQTETETGLPIEPLEQQPIETETVETENIPPNESEIGSTVPEVVKETDGEGSPSIEPVLPSEVVTSSSVVEQGNESDTVSPTVNEETDSVISSEAVNTEPAGEIEETGNSGSEGKEPSVANSSSNDDASTADLESTTSSPNSPIEPIESNETTAEAEATNNPVEESSTTTINPCTEVGNFPNPTNCRQYLSCSGNATNLVPEEIQCPERSAYNPELQRCTRDLTPCANEEPICLITSSIPNPNGENSSYFWCVPNLLGGFHKYQIQCSENEVFLSLIGRCWNETPLLGFGLINREPNDRDVVRAEWKLLKREVKLKLKEEKLKKKMEEKAKARAEKLAAKELRKQKAEEEDDD